MNRGSGRGRAALAEEMSEREATVTALRPFALSAGLAAGMTALWVGLSFVTDLVYHFHPFLVGAAAGWGWRIGARGRLEVRAGVVIAAVTSVFVGAGAGMITAGDRALDALWFVALVAAAGLGVGLRLARGARTEGGST